jgi:hypothetical protein
MFTRSGVLLSCVHCGSHQLTFARVAATQRPQWLVLWDNLKTTVVYDGRLCYQCQDHHCVLRERVHGQDTEWMVDLLAQYMVMQVGSGLSASCTAVCMDSAKIQVVWSILFISVVLEYTKSNPHHFTV